MTPSFRGTFLRLIQAGGAVLGAAWWFHSQWIVPLRHREAESLQQMAGVRERIETAREEMQMISEQEQEAARARNALNSLYRHIPASPAVAWFPGRLREHFRRLGIDEIAVRLNTTAPEPEFPAYERTYWRVNMPVQGGSRNMNGILLAVAEFEQQETFVKILDLSFRSGPGEPGGPTGGFNAAAFVRK